MGGARLPAPEQELPDQPGKAAGTPAPASVMCQIPD